MMDFEAKYEELNLLYLKGINARTNLGLGVGRGAKGLMLAAFFVFMIYSFSFCQMYDTATYDASYKLDNSDSCKTAAFFLTINSPATVQVAISDFKAYMSDYWGSTPYTILSVEGGQGGQYEIIYFFNTNFGSHDCDCFNTYKPYADTTIYKATSNCDGSSSNSGQLTDSHMSIFMWFFCGLVCGSLFCWGVFFNK
ncbi:MAG TPA: hypothetical protein VMR41_02370 [Patescibacteria group bacterium]|nr:hypothetical protein [Patescibacteria group bacterium]